MGNFQGKRVISIISLTSDIGTALAERYSKRGDVVIGTYRSENSLSKSKLTETKGCYPFYCDISDKKSISEFVKTFRQSGLEWDTFISCPSNPLPLTSFFGGDFDEWSKSVHVNSIEQLRVLHELYPFRNKKRVSNIVYFAGGGGSNAAVVNFSAYNVAKILLAKMCEFLDVENKDINAFIVGPGWTRTKTHKLILENVNPSDERYRITKEFLKTKKGTSMDDIFDCIEWLCEQGREVAGGRNFSVVYDKWKEGEELARELKTDKNMFKLRRHRG
ncbi:MAG: SDR family NAD(P)-dependent oxidoreductase [Candidatus Pacearchaeota archaeon]|nr:SDR family NAD(P)-dependent oxidoreductase [Candidatus Pacearchaeota archaeon]